MTKRKLKMWEKAMIEYENGGCDCAKHKVCEGIDHQYNPVTLDGRCVECGGLDPASRE